MITRGGATDAGGPSGMQSRCCRFQIQALQTRSHRPRPPWHWLEIWCVCLTEGTAKVLLAAIGEFEALRRPHKALTDRGADVPLQSFPEWCDLAVAQRQGDNRGRQEEGANAALSPL